MDKALRALGASSLGLILRKDSAAHFTKRLAYVHGDGHPPDWALAEQRHRFVLEACNRHSRVEAAIRQASRLLMQASRAPPLEWLNFVELTQENFYQQTFDHFTLVLYSTLDRTLLLANYIVGLGVHDRLATYKTVQKELKNRDQLSTFTTLLLASMTP